MLAEKIEQEVQKNHRWYQRWDWKPLIFIMDRWLTNRWLAQRFRSSLKQVKTGVIVACAAGNAADTSVLKQINWSGELATTDSNSIKAFFNGFLPACLQEVKK